MAIGYQKSIDDHFGDRFRVFNKPKSLILKTKEGIKQKLFLITLRECNTQRLMRLKQASSNIS